MQQSEFQVTDCSMLRNIASQADGKQEIAIFPVLTKIVQSINRGKIQSP